MRNPHVKTNTMNTKTALPVKVSRWSLLLLCVFIVAATVLANISNRPATAATNSTINFQARLMAANGAIVPDGDYNVEFKLYNAVTSSGSSQGSCTGDAACLWTETRTTTNKIRVANGYLTANLGSVTAFPAINWDQELWLSMNIGGTGTPGWDGEMSPRLKLTAVPYAFRAGQLVTTNGASTSNLSFVQPTANRNILIPDESGTICLQSSGNCGFLTGSATDYIQNQNSTNQTANFRISGTGRANTSIMTPLLQPTADGTTALKIQNTGATITAMAVDTTNGRVTIGADTAAQETLDVVGNLQVRDAATATKSYRLRTSGGALDLEASGANLVLSVWSGAGYTGTQYNQITFKSDGSSMDFARGFNVGDAAARVGLAGNVNPQYSLDVNGDINTSTQYRIGGTVICTATGCTPASGSANYIQNQNSSDQTANFRISGTGRANTSLQAPLFDTATAVALNIGTTNATAINLNKDTTITGAITQSGGAISMTGNAASQIITTSNNALSIRAGGTAILTLNTSGAGTVNIGTDNTTTVNIGGGTDVARIIRVGDPQSAGTAAQTVSVGSQRSTSTTTIQGGNGSSAIALATASGGNINMTTSGTGTINLTTGSAGVIVKPTTDNGAAFQIQNAAGSYIFNVNTVFGLTNIGLLNIGIGANTAIIDSTNAGDTITIGATNANNVTIGRAAGVVTIQGGTSSSAIALNTATNGKISISSQGTGGINALIGSNGFTVKTTTNSSYGIAIQDASDNYIFSVSTSSGMVTMGAIQATYSGFDGTFDTPFGDLTLGSTSTTVTVQGDASTTVKATSGSFTSTLGFTTPTANRTINVPNESGTICLQSSANCGFVAGTAAGFIQNTTTVQSANFYVQAATSGSVGGIVRANAAGTGNILNLQNGAGTNVAVFGSAGAVTLQNSTNSTAAFQVLAASGGGGNAILRVDSTNERVAIGVITDPIGAKLSIATSSTVGFRVYQGGANDAIQAGNATADFLTVSSTGNMLIKPTTNSTTALQIQNASGVNVLRVDTANQRVAIGTAAPALKFEVQGGDAAIYNSGNNARLVLGDSATTGQYGWLQWDSTNDYFRIETAGSNGLKIKDNFVSIGNIFPSKPLIVGSGTTALLEVGTTGQLQSRTSTNTTTAFQIQNDAGDVYFNADSTNKRIGIGDGNIAPEVALDVWGAIQQTGLQTPNTGATDNNKWTKLGSCTITAQYNQCTTKLEILGGNDGSTGNNTQATVSVRVKQQNALGGAPYVNVNLNDTAEVITKSDIVAVTTVNNGTTTTVELYGRITNTFEDWYYAPILNTGGYGESTWDWSPFSAFVAALPAGTQTAARYGNSNANLLKVEATDAAAFHVQNAAAAQVFNIDTVDQEMMLGAGYGGKHFAASLVGNPFFEVGNSTGNGLSLTQVEGGNAYITHDTDLYVQRTANSTTAFRVLDTDDINLLTVNTTDKRIVLGASDTTAMLLVLDTKTSAGDPTAVAATDGAMYYNSSIQSFRCQQALTWSSCGGGLLSANTAASTAVANTTTETNFNRTYSVPANFCVAGRVIRITAYGTYSTTLTPTLTLRAKFGAYTLAANAVTTASSAANRGWSINATFICNAAPSATSAVNGQGMVNFGLTTTTGALLDMPSTATTNVATNAAQTIQISAQWSAASTSNTTTLRSFIVESLGPSQ